MAGKASTLGGPIRMADYLSIGLLSRLVSPALVDEALRLHGRQSQRRRDLPAHAVAYYVMAMSLYRHVDIRGQTTISVAFRWIQLPTATTQAPQTNAGH